MIDRTLMEINENSEKRYMWGKINLLIRLYFYFKEGVNQIHVLRTLGYALIGIAGVLAIEGSGANWGLITLIGLLSVPPFVLLGWVWAKRGKKTEEYLNVRYLSTFGRYGVQLQERQMELLENINKQLEELNKKITSSTPTVIPPEVSKPLEEINRKVTDIQNGKFIQSDWHQGGSDETLLPDWVPGQNWIPYCKKCNGVGCSVCTP